MDAIITHETRPVLDITTTNAKMTITHSKPKLRIRSERPVMNVDRDPPQFKLTREDVRRQLRKELGNSVSPRFKADAEKRAMEVLNNLPGSSRIPGSDELLGEAATVETSSSIGIAAPVAAPVAAPQESLMDQISVSEQPMVEQPTVEAPKIEWQTGRLAIEWSDFLLEIDWEDISRPQIEVEPYSVEVRIENQPVVRLRLNPNTNFDGVGISIDEQV